MVELRVKACLRTVIAQNQGSALQWGAGFLSVALSKGWDEEDERQIPTQGSLRSPWARNPSPASRAGCLVIDSESILPEAVHNRLQFWDTALAPLPEGIESFGKGDSRIAPTILVTSTLFLQSEAQHIGLNRLFPSISNRFSGSIRIGILGGGDRFDGQSNFPHSPGARNHPTLSAYSDRAGAIWPGALAGPASAGIRQGYSGARR